MWYSNMFKFLWICALAHHIFLVKEATTESLINSIA